MLGKEKVVQWLRALMVLSPLPFPEGTETPG